MAEVRWKLKETLEQYDTNPYALARAMGDQSKAVTLYRLTSPTKKTSRVDLNTLGEIITALRKVTGKTVEITDLFEVVEGETGLLSAAGVPYTGDPETDEVLDAHPDILERINRLERGEAKLIPWKQVKAEQWAKRGL